MLVESAACSRGDMILCGQWRQCDYTSRARRLRWDQMAIGAGAQDAAANGCGATTCHEHTAAAMRSDGHRSRCTRRRLYLVLGASTHAVLLLCTAARELEHTTAESIQIAQTNGAGGAERAVFCLTSCRNHFSIRLYNFFTDSVL